MQTAIDYTLVFRGVYQRNRIAKITTHPIARVPAGAPAPTAETLAALVRDALEALRARPGGTWQVTWSSTEIRPDGIEIRSLCPHHVSSGRT